jgi:hypothetical protein
MDAIQNPNLNIEEALPSHILDPNVVSQMTGGKIFYKEGRFQSNDFNFPKSLSNLLTEFLDKELPVLPIVRFCEKLPQDCPEISEELSQFVGNGESPLTWDGNLITYARSSWVSKGQGVEDWLENGFQPGAVCRAEEGDPLISGQFQWATKSCPDQGRVFDLLVEPQNIISIQGSIIRSSEYQNISCLEEEIKEREGQVVFVHTKTNQLGQTCFIREPFSDQQLREYLNSAVSSRNNHIPESVPVSV